MKPEQAKTSLAWTAAVSALLHSAGDVLFYFPAVVLLHVYVFGLALPLLTALLLLGCALGVGMSVFVPVRKTVLMLILMLIAGGVAAWLLFGGLEHFRSWIAWALAFAALFRGYMLAERRRNGHELFVPAVVLVGLGSNFIVSILAAFGDAALRPFVPVLLWCGFAAIAVFLFMLNKHLLFALAPAGNRSAAASVVGKNTPWLIVLIVIIVAVSFVRSIADAMQRAFEAIVYLIGKLFELFASDSGDNAQPTPQEPPQKPELPVGEPSRLAQILERVMIGLLIAAVAAGVVYLLYRLRHKIKPALHALFNRLLRLLGRNRQWQSQSEGYTDERKRLLQIADLPAVFGRKVKDWLAALLEREPKWEELPDVRAKIRWLYRHRVLHAMRKGYAWNKHNTPQETMQDLHAWEQRGEPATSRAGSLFKNPPRDLPGENGTARESEQTRNRRQLDGGGQALAELYNGARYGDRDAEMPVSPEQLEKLRHKP